MLIKKRMERLINIGNYENIKISVELESKVLGKTAESIKHACLALGKLAESVINQEWNEIKQKSEVKNDSKS